jgi:hypothetical protein
VTIWRVIVDSDSISQPRQIIHGEVETFTGPLLPKQLPPLSVEDVSNFKSLVDDRAFRLLDRPVVWRQSPRTSDAPPEPDQQLACLGIDLG